MNEMEQFLKSSLLETLLEAREEEFETLCVTGKSSFDEDPEQELLNELEKCIKDKKALIKVRKKISKFENYLFNDFEASIRRLYKLGFIDGYNFKREIEDVIDEESRKQKN